MNSIAYSCPNGHLHLIEDNVFVEAIENKIVVTTLNNYVMPLMRYDIGDMGTLDSVKCPFNSNPIIKINRCRYNEHIVTSETGKLNPYILSSIIERITDEIGYVILQYQFIQTSYYEFFVKLVIDSNFNEWKDAIVNIFKKNIKDEYLKKCKFNFEFYNDRLLNENTEKLHFFKNEII